MHVDEDETGGTQDRPGLNAAVDRAVAGDTDGIVSWKIDRFSCFTEGGLRDHTPWVDLTGPRNVAALAGLVLLLYGLVWETGT